MNTYRIAFSSVELDGKIPPGSPVWKTFNGSFENMETAAPTIALLIDEGRAFTTQHAHNWRQSTHYLAGQHLGIDFDTQGVEATLADPFVDQYAAIVYATPSSTPGNPRSRALFLLDTPILQAANYVRAASALIWLFGGKADAQCKDAARFFYGSLGSMPVRRPLELPLAKVKAIITQHETVMARPAKPSTYTPQTADAEEARQLLDRLSPSRADDYATWVEVGMALSTLGGEGLPLWEAWSARSPKYRSGECARKWRSFDGAGITLATLAHYAQQDSPYARP